MRSAARGVGLVEVLVSLVLLSVASLGFLQLKAQSSVRVMAAGQHSQALVLANELVQILSRQYAWNLAALSRGTAWGQIPLCDKACDVEALSGEQLVGWRQRLQQSGLPNAAACVAGDANSFTVTLQWADTGVSISGEGCPQGAQVRLQAAPGVMI